MNWRHVLVRLSSSRGARPTPLPPLAQDPLWGIVGAYDGEPVDEVDDVVYGPQRRWRTPS